MNGRFMRVMVFFDLPVTTKEERKAHSNFRKFLINDGFIMLQYSVYSRTVGNHDDAEKHIQRITRNIPRQGSVRVLSITERQYAGMRLLLGDYKKEEVLLNTQTFLEF